MVVFLSAAGPISSVFNDNPEVVGVTAQYLRVVALSYGFLGIVNLTAAAFNGLKKPLSAATVAAVRLFALLIPLAWAGRELFGLSGLFWGVAVGNLLAGAFGFVLFQINRRRRVLEVTEADTSREALEDRELEPQPARDAERMAE